MPTVRDVLNELKWRHHALDRAVVEYLHRGAPDDTARVPGDRILELGTSFFTTPGPEGPTSIPYHRIRRVLVDGNPYWTRPA